jgi:hypothetical protein
VNHLPSVKTWKLIEYSWDPETGLGEFIYERERTDTLEIETRKEVRPQPLLPHHTGYYIR